jgi:hypothetical protein
VAKAVTQPAEVERLPLRPSLSACLMTAGPGPRVAALLALLRPAAGELVVALDDRADADTERAVADVADRVVRYPYREPVDRPLRWLFSLCRGEWILNLDDDEIPGAELLEALPALAGATDVTHYWLLRRWLWPDRASVIDEHPWSTDYQLRLVRNDPLLLRFPAETHRPIEALGPHRFLQLPLYHADLVLNPVEQREAKARRYEAQRPGKRIAGGPMNHVFHLPERRAGLGTEPLSDADRELVESVLGAAVAGSTVAVAAGRASEEEIDELWAGRETEHRARLEVLDEPERLRAAEQRTFDVRVENLSGTTWPWGERGEPEVRLSYQWLDPDGNVIEYGLRTALPADLGPGEAQVVPLHVLAPPEAGRYRLRLDLVHEHICWFECGVEREVEVAQRLRVALAGADAAVEWALEQLAEEAPELEPLRLSSDPCPPQFGPERAPDLRAYLLEGTAPGRLRDVRVFLTRSWTLVRATRKLQVGVPARPLLRGGQGFLDELATCSHLLLMRPPEPGVRELWLQMAMIGAGRRLGLEIVVQAGPLTWAAGPLGRRFLRRRVKIVPPGELGLR